MIVTIANELIQHGTYECYLKFNKDDDLYWIQKSVPVEQVTPELQAQWIADGTVEAEAYFVKKHTPAPEVEE